MNFLLILFQLLLQPRCGNPDFGSKLNSLQQNGGHGVDHDDRRKRYVIGSEGWKKQSVSYLYAVYFDIIKLLITLEKYHVFINAIFDLSNIQNIYSLANWSNKLWNRTVVSTALTQAFNLWKDYSGLRFIESKDFENSDIVISFGSGYHGDG